MGACNPLPGYKVQHAGLMSPLLATMVQSSRPPFKAALQQPIQVLHTPAAVSAGQRSRLPAAPQCPGRSRQCTWQVCPSTLGAGPLMALSRCC